MTDHAGQGSGLSHAEINQLTSAVRTVERLARNVDDADLQDHLDQAAWRMREVNKRA